MLKRIVILSFFGIGLFSILGAEEIELKSCYSCHGNNWEKTALGVSKVVNEMSFEEIKTSLIGYKDGTYGARLKGVMKGQVIKYSNEELEQIAKQISNKKE